MRTSLPTAGDGACYRRRNDDCGSSFRSRDNAIDRNSPPAVKSLFNLLNLLMELALK